jgi:hypothetical protein
MGTGHHGRRVHQHLAATLTEIAILGMSSNALTQYRRELNVVGFYQTGEHRTVLPGTASQHQSNYRTLKALHGPAGDLMQLIMGNAKRISQIGTIKVTPKL